ncbi:MAG: hypothetical protein RR646_05875 [Erysipelotrichaceae bacterium]
MIEDELAKMTDLERLYMGRISVDENILEVLSRDEVWFVIEGVACNRGCSWSLLEGLVRMGMMM